MGNTASNPVHWEKKSKSCMLVSRRSILAKIGIWSRRNFPCSWLNRIPLRVREGKVIIKSIGLEKFFPWHCLLLQTLSKIRIDWNHFPTLDRNTHFNKFICSLYQNCLIFLSNQLMIWKLEPFRSNISLRSILFLHDFLAVIKKYL